MNFSLKPHQLVAHWVPGFVLLVFVPVLHPGVYDNVKCLPPHGDVLRSLTCVVFAFVLGEFLDACRDLLENVWDLWSEVYWDFFSEAPDADVEKLRTSHFTYYVFNHNLALPLLYFLILRLTSHHIVEFLVALAVAIVFVANAVTLRREIAKITKRFQSNPGAS
jgi:hypothetical protein